jgi:hypothetical protein
MLAARTIENEYSLTRCGNRDKVRKRNSRGRTPNDAVKDGGSMSITSAQSYEMRISRSSDKITDPPEPYWQTVERLLADRGVDHVARLLAYALRDLDKAQGKA